MCGGVAFLDYDNDGWLDILLVNGSTLEDMRRGTSPTSKLYHNNRDGSFTDVTAKADLNHRAWGMGVCVGDYDNDGWEDIYITHVGGGVLYHNNGDGTFRDVTAAAGVGNTGRWGTSCAFGDYDNDGHLDLYVANYVDLDLTTAPDWMPASATRHLIQSDPGVIWLGWYGAKYDFRPEKSEYSF